MKTAKDMTNIANGIEYDSFVKTHLDFFEKVEDKIKMYAEVGFYYYQVDVETLVLLNRKTNPSETLNLEFFEKFMGEHGYKISITVSKLYTISWREN